MDAEIEQACPLGPQSKMPVADDETETPKLNIRTASESRTAEAILMFIPFQPSKESEHNQCNRDARKRVDTERKNINQFNELQKVLPLMKTTWEEPFRPMGNPVPPFPRGPVCPGTEERGA
jgi:hypothetical protein